MKTLLFIASLLLAHNAWAAPASAADEEFVFRAERATANLDDKSGHARYEGNAELIQGKRVLKADIIDFQTENNQVSRVEAQGSPVSLEDEEQQLFAQARTLIYNVTSQTLFLQGEARLSQQGRQFEGDELEYDLAARRIRASGGTEGGRIKLVIPATGNTLSP